MSHHRSSIYNISEGFAGQEEVGVNPKVNNLMRSYRKAAYDILWVLDSNVMVDPETLARSVDALDDPVEPSSRRRIALVHHIPFAWASEHSIGSRLEEAFLNTNHAKMYIAINTVAVDSCVVGKSNLYRRSDLERVNGSLKQIPDVKQGGRQQGKTGLATFGRFLAEDNMIASALWHELDVRHELSCDVARNAVGNMSLMDYVRRRARWVRVRKRMVLMATLIEPLTESVLLGILVSLAVNYLFGIAPWMFLPIHFILWLLVDMDVFASLAGHPVPPSSRWAFIVAWLARELLALPIWMYAIVGDEIEWRGKRYEIIRNGEVRMASTNHDTWKWFCWSNSKRVDHYEPVPLA